MKKGFTLVELAIVIVIVGLVIGAVLAGQDLIANSERQGVIKEFQKFNNAATTFKQQFTAFPGDMENAATYWSGCAVNGDGSGYIDTTNEWGSYWAAHLKCAELISIKDPATVKSNLKNGRFYFSSTYSSIDNVSSSIGSDISIYDKKGNYILLMGGAAGGATLDGVLAPNAAQYIDSKIDDGKASSGNLAALPEYVSGTYPDGTCMDHAANFLSADSEGSINYTLSSKTKSCRLIYWLNHLD